MSVDYLDFCNKLIDDAIDFTLVKIVISRNNWKMRCDLVLCTQERQQWWWDDNDDVVQARGIKFKWNNIPDSVVDNLMCYLYDVTHFQTVFHLIYC